MKGKSQNNTYGENPIIFRITFPKIMTSFQSNFHFTTDYKNTPERNINQLQLGLVKVAFIRAED